MCCKFIITDSTLYPRRTNTMPLRYSRFPPENSSIATHVTLVIFAQFPSTHAGPYFQRTQDKKYLAAYEAQRFEFFVRSPLKKLSQRNKLLEGNYNENDQRACVNFRIIGKRKQIVQTLLLFYLYTSMCIYYSAT